MDEHSSSSPNSTLGIFSGNSMNWELMDEILYQGWAENDGEFSFLQQGPSTTNVLYDHPSLYMPFMGSNNLSVASNQQDYYQEETERHCHGNPPLDFPKSMELVQTESQVEDSVVTSTSVLQSTSYRVEAAGLGVEWQMAPRVIPMTSCSVKERAMQVVRYLQKFIEYKDSLIQIWLPMEKEGKTVLATIDQPYFVNPSCKSLASYRNVSTAYHFQVDQDAKLSAGFPGRVFLEKLPEWTPDVCLFRSEEYPRRDHALQHNIKGSLALPFFNQGSETCLGIVEIVTTTLKISYRQELEDICRALKAVNLRSSEDFCSPSAKTFNGLNQVAVPEIAEIVQSVCKAYRLPLALTWALCGRQGKSGRQQFPEKFGACISTVDSACFLADGDFSGFHMASSEQNIIPGQGIVGRAFTAKKQCFAKDITSFRKKDYPLAHHATIFGLHAAMAIPLRSISTGSVEFVLELFLPKDCRDTKEQKRMWDALPSAIQQVCWSLQVVMDKEQLDNGENQSFGSSLSKQPPLDESSWISRMVEAQKKSKSFCVTWGYPKEPKEEFKMITHWDDSVAELDHKQVISELGKLQQNYRPASNTEGDGVSSAFGRRLSFGSRKTGKKRRTKTDIQTISLEVLRQYFAGSLKDAAQSLSVCPTTLKRICRQHGITRWPSRKIKKVDHSLRKLQQVIDTVQGAKGSIQIESFYSAFPELSCAKLSSHAPSSSLKRSDSSKHSDSPPDGTTISGTASKSHSSTCSRSSCSSNCCSARAQQHVATAITGSSNGNGASLAETSNGVLKRTCSSELAELYSLNNEGEPDFLSRSHAHNTGTISEQIHESVLETPAQFGQSLRGGGVFRVKACFGEEKVTLFLQPNWGLRNLHQEIGKRFQIEDFTGIGLKYMDDDGEWIRLTCDGDLEDCKETHRFCQTNTIKISLYKYSPAYVCQESC